MHVFLYAETEGPLFPPRPSSPSSLTAVPGHAFTINWGLRHLLVPVLRRKGSETFRQQHGTRWVSLGLIIMYPNDSLIEKKNTALLAIGNGGSLQTFGIVHSGRIKQWGENAMLNQYRALCQPRTHSKYLMSLLQNLIAARSEAGDARLGCIHSLR